MKDFIRIKDLEVFANHGVFQEENVLGQKFLITAYLYMDLSKAGLSDDLNMSVNYGEVSAKITEFMKENTFALIERVAENLAAYILDQFPLLEGIRLEIKKPWAPVGLPLDTVSVNIERFWHTTYIALGSNIGDSRKYLDDAVKALADSPSCQLGKVSSWIVTKPYGGVEQADFLNGALELRTTLSPEALLDRLHEIEAAASRVREVHWGPRTLDLDILLYDQEIIDSNNLHIPHIDMQNRDFVLNPMVEIAPWLRHPILNKTMSQLQKDLLEGK